jgi:hypothetical protein
VSDDVERERPDNASSLTLAEEASWVEPRDKTILSGRANVKIMWRFSLGGFFGWFAAADIIASGARMSALGFRSPRPSKEGIDVTIDDARTRDRT